MVTTFKPPTTSTFYFQTTLAKIEIDPCFDDGYWCSDPDWTNVYEIHNIKGNILSLEYFQ